MTTLTVDDPLATPPAGARSLLLTMLGEFVLPAGGAVWTSTVVDGLASVGITERNARQAVARLGEQGIVEAERRGRRTRWHLTDTGRALLTSGAERIYSFGRRADDWAGSWLLVICSIPESRRTDRARFRTQLTFEGFGFLAPGMAISPHPDREKAANDILAGLALDDEAMTFVASSGDITDDAEILATAWDLGDLAARYGAFVDEFDAHHGERDVDEPAAAFATTLGLVDTWRRFPFADPELPTELLPENWIGGRAHDVFDAVRSDCADAARSWFDELEVTAAAT